MNKLNIKILKKYLSSFLICTIFLTFASKTYAAFSFFKKRTQPKKQESVNFEGYKGDLPNLNETFENLKQEYNISLPPNIKKEINENDLIKSPINDDMYIKIISKKNKKSEFVNDAVDVKVILAKVNESIINGYDIQKFNASVNSLIDNIAYVQTKYKGRLEENYILFKNFNYLYNLSKDIMELTYEAQVYSKFLTYSESKAKYKSENVKKEINKYNAEVKKTIQLIDNLL